jgi:hypothetical protein
LVDEGCRVAIVVLVLKSGRLFIYGAMSVFTKLLKMAMISRISAPAPARIPALLHDLQHRTVVQERLGHAAIAITLDLTCTGAHSAAHGE